MYSSSDTKQATNHQKQNNPLLRLRKLQTVFEMFAWDVVFALIALGGKLMCPIFTNSNEDEAV